MKDRHAHLLEVVEVRLEHFGYPREEVVDPLVVVCRVPQQRKPELESRLHQVDLVKPPYRTVSMVPSPRRCGYHAVQHNSPNVTQRISSMARRRER